MLKAALNFLGNKKLLTFHASRNLWNLNPTIHKLTDPDVFPVFFWQSFSPAGIGCLSQETSDLYAEF